MVHAHKGYFRESGQFVLENLATKIPLNQQVIILWDDESIENKKLLRLAKVKREAAQNFLSAIKKIRIELTADDKSALDELESGKYKPIFENRNTEL